MAVKIKLFLCGPGASEIIRNALGDRIAEAGGIITEDVYNQNILTGSFLLPAAAAAGVPGYEREQFADYTSVPPTHDTEVFRNTGTRLVQEAAYYNFSVFDRLGGFELMVPQFRSALTDYLNSEQPCLGVLYTKAEAEDLCKRLGLTSRYLMLVENMITVIGKAEDCTVIKLNLLNKRHSADQVNVWVREYL